MICNIDREPDLLLTVEQLLFEEVTSWSLENFDAYPRTRMWARIANHIGCLDIRLIDLQQREFTRGCHNIKAKYENLRKLAASI